MDEDMVRLLKAGGVSEQKAREIVDRSEKHEAHKWDGFTESADYAARLYDVMLAETMDYGGEVHVPNVFKDEKQLYEAIRFLAISSPRDWEPTEGENRYGDSRIMIRDNSIVWKGGPVLRNPPKPVTDVKPRVRVVPSTPKTVTIREADSR